MIKIAKLTMLILLITACNSDKLAIHLKNLKELNNQIDTKGWEVKNHSKGLMSEDYALKKQVGDTLILLSFSYFEDIENGLYKIDKYTKSYYSESFYYEMELHNNDTLYFFRYRKDEIIYKPVFYLSKDKMEFVTGKYYYLRKSGKYNFGQMEYFELHKDSLTKIRGNSLEDLPVLKKGNEEDFVIEEEEETLVPAHNNVVW